MKRRIDELTWSKRIHYVKDFPSPGTVRDQEGTIFATKRAKSVPVDSSAQAPAPSTLEDTLRNYAEGLRATVQGGPRTISQATATLPESRPGLKQLLRNAAITSTAFIDMLPELISRNGRTLTAT